MDTIDEGPRLHLSVHERGRDLAAALVTGQVAGMAMLVAMMAFALLQGREWVDPLRAIGSMLFLEPILQPGAGVVVLGFIVHQFGFTLFWSLVYAALVGSADRRHPWHVTALGLGGRFGMAAIGPLVGMAAQLVDVLVLMPNVAQGADWTHVFTGVGSWAYHLLFGFGLALFPWVRRGFFGAPLSDRFTGEKAASPP